MLLRIPKTEEIHAGCSAMAVGGTGDALAGICGGFWHKVLPFETGCLAALHWGKAGETLQKKIGVSFPQKS